MNVLDNAIKQLWRDGIKTKMIWVNASPASIFGAQELRIDNSPFNKIKIFYKTNLADSNEYTNCQSIEVNVSGNGFMTGIAGNNGLADGTVTIAARSCEVTASGIKFASGGYWIPNNETYKEFTGEHNNWIIPTEIYGLKFLIGGGQSSN